MLAELGQHVVEEGDAGLTPPRRCRPGRTPRGSRSRGCCARPAPSGRGGHGRVTSVLPGARRRTSRRAAAPYVYRRPLEGCLASPPCPTPLPRPSPARRPWPRRAVPGPGRPGSLHLVRLPTLTRSRPAGPVSRTSTPRSSRPSQTACGSANWPNSTKFASESATRKPRRRAAPQAVAFGSQPATLAAAHRRSPRAARRRLRERGQVVGQPDDLSPTKRGRPAGSRRAPGQRERLGQRARHHEPGGPRQQRHALGVPARRTRRTPRRPRRCRARPGTPPRSRQAAARCRSGCSARTGRPATGRHPGSRRRPGPDRCGSPPPGRRHPAGAVTVAIAGAWSRTARSRARSGPGRRRPAELLDDLVGAVGRPDLPPVSPCPR